MKRSLSISRPVLRLLAALPVLHPAVPTALAATSRPLPEAALAVRFLDSARLARLQPELSRHHE
jgi:hypothetical protein